MEPTGGEPFGRWIWLLTPVSTLSRACQEKCPIYRKEPSGSNHIMWPFQKPHSTNSTTCQSSFSGWASKLVRPRSPATVDECQSTHVPLPEDAVIMVSEPVLCLSTVVIRLASDTEASRRLAPVLVALGHQLKSLSKNERRQRENHFLDSRRQENLYYSIYCRYIMEQ